MQRIKEFRGSKEQKFMGNAVSLKQVCDKIAAVMAVYGKIKTGAGRRPQP
jgi:hypothetical protein